MGPELAVGGFNPKPTPIALLSVFGRPIERDKDNDQPHPLRIARPCLDFEGRYGSQLGISTFGKGITGAIVFLTATQDVCSTLPALLRIRSICGGYAKFQTERKQGSTMLPMISIKELPLAQIVYNPNTKLFP